MNIFIWGDRESVSRAERAEKIGEGERPRDQEQEIRQSKPRGHQEQRGQQKIIINA